MTEPAVDPQHEAVPEWVRNQQQPAAQDAQDAGQQPADADTSDGVAGGDRVELPD